MENSHVFQTSCVHFVTLILCDNKIMTLIHSLPTYLNMDTETTPWQKYQEKIYFAVRF